MFLIKIFDNINKRALQHTKNTFNNKDIHLFRPLTYKEKHHTKVFDFRNLEKQPKNKILVTCEHATNNFHQYQNKLTPKDL